MYIPKHYENKDIDKAVKFMQTFNFATIVTSEMEKPTASHLPFVITKRNDKIILASHFSKANQQNLDFDKKNILTIFSEPHAYVSPKHYDKKQNVPTWNYVSVHVYGKAKIIVNEIAVFKMLEQMIATFEKEYLNQWNELDISYKSKMANGITAFEITVEEIQFKEKLSQNKTKSERKNIITELAKSENANENLVAKYMAENE